LNLFIVVLSVSIIFVVIVIIIFVIISVIIVVVIATILLVTVIIVVDNFLIFEAVNLQFSDLNDDAAFNVTIRLEYQILNSQSKILTSSIHSIVSISRYLICIYHKHSIHPHPITRLLPMALSIA
jgi:hypothetical protein